MGEIHAPDGRVVLVTETLVQSLHGHVNDQFGERAPDVFYRTGYEWALRDMVGLHRECQSGYGAGFDFWQMDARFVLDTWWATLAAKGWGAATFDTSALTRGLLFVEVRGGLLAAAQPRSPRPTCHLTAGLMAGALSFYERGERHAVEVQCVAVGDEWCGFVVGPGADVDSAESWRQQGVTAAEIRRRLGGGA